MSDTPLTAIGDEAIEARIVAWVLGEASAFEAAELERLCAERPELAIFHRRMQALHGLIGETTMPQPVEDWKLSPEKRKAVEDAFGEEKPIRLETVKRKRIRFSARRAILAIAACVMISVVILKLMPRNHTSQAVLEVRPKTLPMSPLGPTMSETSGRNAMTAQFFSTEFEKIKSRQTLEKVVDKLDLAERWGTDKEQAIDQLKKRVETQNIRGTDLLAIQVKDRDKATADEIAREVTYAYKNYRDTIEQRDAEQQLQELGKAVREQEDKVEERRKVLSTITRTKNIEKPGTRDESAVSRGLDHQDYAAAKHEFETEEELLRAMKIKLTGESIARRIPSSSVEIHELPGGQTESSSAMALASKEPMKSLRTDLPAERIEGTPKPIVLPGQTPSKEMAKAKAPLSSPFTAKPSAQPEEALVMQEKKVSPDSERKPSAPSSSMSKAIASATAKNEIPVPEVDVTKPSLDFGDGRDFGTGWGDASGGAGGGFSREIAANGTRSGDGDVKRENIDNVLSDPNVVWSDSHGALTDSIKGGLKKDLSNLADNGVARDPYWDTSKVAEGGKSYEIHSGYKSEYLFRGADLGADQKGNAAASDDAVPEITTRSVLSADEAVAEAQSLRKSGKYDEARKTLEGALTTAPSDAKKVANELAYLDDPIRTNPAVTYEHTQKVDKVRRDLYKAEGNYNLGKYDEAKKEYENALRTDPYNQAARRGLEKLAAAKSDYYRAAYDHTRAELLTDVDKAWELAVPTDSKKTSDEHIAGFTGQTESTAQENDERAQLLAEVDKAWGLTERKRIKQKPSNTEFWVADESTKTQLAEADSAQYQQWLGAWNTYPEGKELDGFVNYGSPIGGEAEQPGAQSPVGQKDLPIFGRLFNSNTTNSETWSNLAQREMIRRQSTMAEADRLLTDARNAYAAGDYQKAYETYEKSLNLIPDVPENPALQERRAFLRKSLGDAAIALSMSAKKFGKVEDSKEWLSKARAWDPTNPQAKEESEVDASAETSAAEEPYSTFSLNISDASFRIAQAALAKGERPDPAGIKVEQFYNAVDYGDPAPTAGEPVACAIEQAAHPVIPGRNLVRVSLKTAAAGRSAAQPLRLTLLVDQSGSMSRADRREAMAKALSSLGGLLTAQDKVSVIGFARTSRLIADGLTGDQAAASLANLANPAASEGGTNLETAIDLAAQLATRHQTQGAQNRIVLFTDGAANLGDADPQRLAAKVEKLRQQGLAFDIAGIAADDLNDNLLGELARKGNGRYSVVGKGENADFAKQLAGAFRPAAENVKVQVRFNPERVSRYKLIGFDKDRLKTEDFRNDKVDAAELAAEEAGVAIYQVETIPDGRGEIGEVSVRFRDTARGEMVERMWTMPHAPSAPALDQAAPSMQLATLAMLAGEKLKGGPLADAIDFKQLAAAQATVKQVFGQDTRIADMLRIIDALK